MLTCKEIAALATEFAEGGLEAAERLRFETHLGGCADCRAWVRQLEVTALAVGKLPPPELPAALEAELQRRFADWQERRAGRSAAAAAPGPGDGADRRARWALPAVGAAAVAMVGLARAPSHDAADWLVGLGLLAAALALAALLRRLDASYALTATSAALAAALLRGAPGPLAALGGLDCLLSELGLAAGTAGLAWLVARRGPSVLSRPGLGAWAVAGALAGDAALQLSCPHHGALPHLVLFHAGGVIAVAAAGWALARRAPQAA